MVVNVGWDDLSISTEFHSIESPIGQMEYAC